MSTASEMAANDNAPPSSLLRLPTELIQAIVGFVVEPLEEDPLSLTLER